MLGFSTVAVAGYIEMSAAIDGGEYVRTKDFWATGSVSNLQLAPDQGFEP